MTEHNFETMRAAMVASQIRTTDVSDARVVAAMKTIPREVFVPAERRGVAYADIAVPLADGRALAAPMATGKLLTHGDVQPGDHVLLIGAGTGYSAAILAQLAASVIAVEEDTALAATASANLAGSANVTVAVGPLTAGWAGAAPYDLIIIDGAVETIPDSIIQQLKDGGRLVAGWIDQGVTRLASGRRAGAGFGMTSFADADVPTLPGFAKPRTFAF